MVEAAVAREEAAAVTEVTEAVPSEAAHQEQPQLKLNEAEEHSSDFN